MRNISRFAKELFRGRVTKWLLLLYALFGFAATVADQFFPSYSEKLKMLYIFPKWDWRIWIIISMCILVIVLFEGAYRIWREREQLESTAPTNSPQVILDFKSLPDDRPTKRKRLLILRNLGAAVAFNVKIDPFTVGDTTVICDPVDRLLQESDTAQLTAEIRTGNDVRKPCLVQLEPLYEFARKSPGANQEIPTPLFITYSDSMSRKFRVEYQVKYMSGINECKMEFKTLRIIGVAGASLRR